MTIYRGSDGREHVVETMPYPYLRNARASLRKATDEGRVNRDVELLALDTELERRDILRHSLGLTVSAKPYRNYFSAPPDNSHWESLLALVERGLMERGHTDASGTVFFHVTEAGCALMGTTRAQAEA